jgi:hypothetical protein
MSESESESEPTEAERRRHDHDEIIVESLVAGMSYAEVGDLANCSGRTVARRMADPEFVRQVSERRGERVSAITGQLIDVAVEAVGVIQSCFHAENDGHRLRAADMALTLLMRFRHETELEGRVAELERQLEVTISDDGEVAR